jgi:hypothetical protein
MHLSLCTASDLRVRVQCARRFIERYAAPSTGIANGSTRRSATILWHYDVNAWVLSDLGRESRF